MILSLIAAFAVTLVATPLVARVCRSAQLLDGLGALKIHTRPIPRFGGIAIFAGILIGMAILPTRDVIARPWFIAALALIWSCGFLDDLFRLSPFVRLIAQITAAFFLWCAGWRLPIANAAAAVFLTIAIVVLYTNALNFLDGADGLAAGFACVVGLSQILLHGSSPATLPFAIAPAVGGACAAFLVYNSPPARVHMGDSGSTVLGFLFASLALSPHTGSAQNTFLPALVIVGLPLLDALVVVTARLANGRAPYAGDRNHFYDLWLKRGWTPGAVMLMSCIVTAWSGAVSALVTRSGIPQMWLLVALVPTLLWTILPRMAIFATRLPLASEKPRLKTSSLIFRRNVKRTQRDPRAPISSGY